MFISELSNETHTPYLNIDVLANQTPADGWIVMKTNYSATGMKAKKCHTRHTVSSHLSCLDVVETRGNASGSACMNNTWLPKVSVIFSGKCAAHCFRDFVQTPDSLSLRFASPALKCPMTLRAVTDPTVKGMKAMFVKFNALSRSGGWGPPQCLIRATFNRSDKRDLHRGCVYLNYI